MKESASHSDPRPRKVSRRAFTLVELMVVVTILALLFMMLIPSIGSAVEWARISNCSSILHNIGNAVQQYVSENHDHLMSYCWTDQRAYEILSLPPYAGVDGQGNTYNYTYCAWYDYHNQIAPYLGLGNCMPLDDSGKPNYKWSWAKYSGYKEYQCPSGLKMWSPYGAGVSGFYMQNAGWRSQNFQYSWPGESAYFPKFVDTSSAILYYENWTCNAMTTDLDPRAQPYSTHYKRGSKGPMGIGRNMLYADFHIKFLQSGDSPDTVSSCPWQFGGMPVWIIGRANEEGYKFYSQYDGRQYTAWGPSPTLTQKG